MQGGIATAGRKRAAVELVAREGAELRRTARRFSLCEDDAEDAYQRALEILLVKAPSERPRELVGWMKTVVKHEALAIRRYRERMLGVTAPDSVGDPVERLVADNAEPSERTEQREQIARSREALQMLKPAELRSLTLLAAGYSYAEIGEITGFTRTKVNRSLAEGRERFRRMLSSSEDGTRCAELLPLLSAYCDGESSGADEAAVREHLRACVACQATARSYRATPAAVAALAPALPVSRSLVERAHELLVNLHSRLPGVGADDGGIAQVAAAGGSRGAGMAALAKVLTICAGTVGGATACVVTGVAPLPMDVHPQHSAEAKVERVSKRAIEEVDPPAVESGPATPHSSPEPRPEPEPAPEPAAEVETSEPAPESVEAGAVEYAPPPEPAPSPEPASSTSGSAAGEFGP